MRNPEPEERSPVPLAGGGRAKKGPPNLTEYFCYGI